ncbi:hypothetical protein MXD60_27355 [Frankia sp. AgB32]|nr:hypothetical protein [Frankia sp. AgB32]MCK9898253.1 hypothetical protein [Frankia sp. AgB32]
MAETTAAPSIRAVLFDLAGTLFSDRALRDVHLAQLRYAAEVAQVAASDVDLRRGYRQGMGLAYREFATRPFYLHRDLFASSFWHMAAALGGAITPEAAHEAAWRQCLATIRHASLRPEAEPSLRRSSSPATETGYAPPVRPSLPISAGTECRSISAWSPAPRTDT